MADDLIKQAVDKFLGWPLPKDFAPDCGVAFDGRKDDEWNKNKTWPVGTNLFTADQARAMFEHCIGAALRAERETLACGHHKSLAVISAETGALLYCELCDCRQRRNDAETMEGELRAALRERDAEIARLRTVMIAAAEEIHEHWDAHCDAEGYGPANLMRRLEEGIPSEYGYTAGAFAELKQRAERLADALRSIAEICDEEWHVRTDSSRVYEIRNYARVALDAELKP